MSTKLYDISDWCRKGSEVEDYPYIGEINKNLSMGSVVSVGGKFCSIGVLNFQNQSAGVRLINLNLKPNDIGYENNITCPYCGYANQDSWECADSDDNHICGRCEAEMSYERVVTVEYNSSPKKPPHIVKANWLQCVL